MKPLKHFGALVLIVVLLYAFLVTFSAQVSKFGCSGEITSKEGPRPEIVYIELTEYRWWVSLWSDSDGNLGLEIPNKTLEYYSHIVEVGNQRQIYSFEGKPVGVFSTLSKKLGLKTPIGVFDGTCKKID